MNVKTSHIIIALFTTIFSRESAQRKAFLPSNRNEQLPKIFKDNNLVQEEDEPEETTDIIEALKASLKVKSMSSAKAKGKMGMAISK